MGALDRLDGFCAPVSQFWRRDSYCNNLHAELGDPNATCHDEVDFSLCFEDTAILYSICAIFWLLAGLELLFLKSARPRISFNWLNTTKTLLTAVPFVTALCDLAYTIYKGAHDGSDSVANYQYLTPPVLAISMVVAVLVLQLERRLGIRSSALLFLFWMSMAIYGSFKLRSLVLTSRDQGEVTDVFLFTTFCLQYAAYLLEFLLAFFPEPKSPFAYRWGDDQEKKPCPEGDATFLSRITWWWLNGLIWRGWRRSLDYDDLTDLNYEDKSRVVAPQFQRNWDRELQKAGWVEMATNI